MADILGDVCKEPVMVLENAAPKYFWRKWASSEFQKQANKNIYSLKLAIQHSDKENNCHRSIVKSFFMKN